MRSTIVSLVNNVASPPPSPLLSSYTRIYTYSIYPRGTIERITDRVPRDTSPSPRHVESVITVLARAENSRTGWNVSSAESRIAGKKKKEKKRRKKDWRERGMIERERWKRGVSPFFSVPSWESSALFRPITSFRT